MRSNKKAGGRGGCGKAPQAGANMAVPYLMDEWLERQLVKMQ